ncbi:MAG: glycine zipper 2TM domain-containing protein [Gammaproteobacteria bacterium]|nr:glycine zipper 2TM domain-containing protein [Gammaproteobacteria bacterium]
MFGQPVVHRVIQRDYVPARVVSGATYYDGGHYDDARVIRVVPIVRQVRVVDTQYECWNENVTHTTSNGNTAAATIAGGLIGGVLGRQIGGGSGRDGMTVVGTLVGSAIANDQAQRNSGRTTYQDTVERCENRPIDYYEDRIDGYDVTYEYNGREYQTSLSYDPGNTIKVRVDVSPN